MKAMILVAGSARRMEHLTENTHKSLLEIGGIAILGRIMNALISNDVNDIIFVCGYRKNDLRQYIRDGFPECNSIWVENNDYTTTNTAYSVLLGKETAMEFNDDILLLNGDVVLDERAISVTLNQSGQNVLAVRTGEVGEEEVKVIIDDEDNITEIGKHIEADIAAGESVGINRLSREILPVLFDTISMRCNMGDGRTEFYEVTFNELVKKGYIFGIADVTNVPVMEIDTPEDYAYVNETILPQLDD